MTEVELSLTEHTALSTVIGYRDAALKAMEEALALRAQADELVERAQDYAARANCGTSFYLNDRSAQDVYRGLMDQLDVERAARVYREHVDACTWLHLLNVTGLEALMDRTAKEAWLNDLAQNPPEVTSENVLATFDFYRSEAKVIFLA